MAVRAALRRRLSGRAATADVLASSSGAVRARNSGMLRRSRSTLRNEKVGTIDEFPDRQPGTFVLLSHLEGHLARDDADSAEAVYNSLKRAGKVRSEGDTERERGRLHVDQKDKARQSRPGKNRMEFFRERRDEV